MCIIDTTALSSASKTSGLGGMSRYVVRSVDLPPKYVAVHVTAVRWGAARVYSVSNRFVPPKPPGPLPSYAPSASTDAVLRFAANSISFHNSDSPTDFVVLTPNTGTVRQPGELN